MNQKKSKKVVLILIIIICLILVIGGGVLAYFLTDIFKSNKDLFFKYVTQIADKENGFVEDTTKLYFEKKKGTPYTNEGEFLVNATTLEEKNLDKLNQFNIKFTGKTDKPNSKIEHNITLNYSDTVNFPINYKHIENKVGIQTEYVGSKHIAVETDALNNLSGEQIEPLKEIGDVALKIQNFMNLTPTDAEIEQIKNTYLGILNEELKPELFSKINDTNGEGYKLTLSGEDLNNVLVKLLEKLEQDEATLNKINEYIKIQKNSAKITNSDITEKIEEIKQGKILNNENLEITVYKSKGKTSKITLSVNEVKINIQKTSNKQETKYEVGIELSINNENLKANLALTYQGLESDNVNENYELSIETAQNQYNYQLSNQINFVGNVSIEDFTDQNSIVLTDLENEPANTFLNTVEERLIQVNNSQMQELGVSENENPINYIKPDLGTYSDMLENMNKPNISEEDVNAFNQKFELYQSTNLQGVTVRGLLSTISLNNESQEEDRQIKEINFDGQEYEASNQNITFIKEDIEPETSYRVEFEKDQNTGLIYRVVINKK